MVYYVVLSVVKFFSFPSSASLFPNLEGAMPGGVVPASVVRPVGSTGPFKFMRWCLSTSLAARAFGRSRPPNLHPTSITQKNEARVYLPMTALHLSVPRPYYRPHRRFIFSTNSFPSSIRGCSPLVHTSPAHKVYDAFNLLWKTLSARDISDLSLAPIALSGYRKSY
jgi:hypothetical protein